jgi:hypothetical protein
VNPSFIAKLFNTVRRWPMTALRSTTLRVSMKRLDAGSIRRRLMARFWWYASTPGIPSLTGIVSGGVGCSQAGGVRAARRDIARAASLASAGPR